MVLPAPIKIKQTLLFSKEKQLNRRKQIISSLLVVVILITYFLALFSRHEYKQSSSVQGIHYCCTPILQPIPEEIIRRAAYLSELNELDMLGMSTESWFKEYKIISEKYNDVSDSKVTIYDAYSISDLELLFKVVQAEIGNGYSFEQKANVCSVILNRLNDGRFGNSLKEVLNEAQFSVISNGAIYRVEIEERTILACEYVYLFGDTTGNALFFHNGKARENFCGRLHKFYDGAHNFY